MRRTTNFTLASGAAATTRLFFSGHTMGGRGFDDFRDDFGEPEDHRVLVRKLAPSDADRPFGFGRTQVMEADAGDMHAESGVGNQRDAEASANQIQNGEQLASFLNDAGHEPSAAAKGKKMVVKGHGDRAWVRNEGAVAQASEAFSVIEVQRARNCGDQTFAEERRRFQERIVDGHADDADIDFAVEQAAQLRRGGHVAHVKLDGGIGAVKAEDRARDDLGNGSDSEADAE